MAQQTHLLELADVIRDVLARLADRAGNGSGRGRRSHRVEDGGAHRVDGGGDRGRFRERRDIGHSRIIVRYRFLASLYLLAAPLGWRHRRGVYRARDRLDGRVTACFEEDEAVTDCGHEGADFHWLEPIDAASSYRDQPVVIPRIYWLQPVRHVRGCTHERSGSPPTRHPSATVSTVDG